MHEEVWQVRTSATYAHESMALQERFDCDITGA